MQRLAWGERTYVMGVLNVTPDSFSGDGLALAGRSDAEVVSAALDQAHRFVVAGADILDVGAESSRPAAVYGEHPPVDLETELGLAIPVIEALAADLGDRVMISIDTTKGDVARAALDAGAGMVNDVWAARRDPGTAEAAAAAGAYLVVMHNKDVAEYPDGVLPEVIGWLRSAAEDAARAGVARDRILIDPGIGFGKTPDHSLEVLHRLGELKAALGLPLLVGTSRKRFIGEILGGVPPDQRLEGSTASTVLAIAAGADVIRVHDVEFITRAVRVADAIIRRPDAATAPDLPGRITLLGTAATGHHGVGDDERSREQPFVVDVVVSLDVQQAVDGDDLEQTVNYAELQSKIVERVSTTRFRLIESLAAAIGEAVLVRWPVATTVEVAVRKPEAPMSAPFERVEARVRLTRG
jgi:dihydropteroate synthase